MKSLRVVQVIGTATGGDWFVDLVTTLSNRGHVVIAVTPDEGPLTNRLRSAGIAVYVCRFKGRSVRDLPRTVMAMIRLSFFLRRQRPDVVHAHLFKAILVARLATFGLSIPVRVSQWPGDVHLDTALFRQMDMLTMARDCVILGSCTAIVERYRRLRRNIAVECAYYGLHLDAWNPHRRDLRDASAAFRLELGLPQRVLLVGMVAYMYRPIGERFSKVGLKGHEVFIDAASQVLARRSDVHFLIVGDEFAGDGKYRASLQRLVVERGLSDQIVFLGHRTDVDVVMAALDIVVVPSMAESASFAAVQAALLERPVVASNVGGLPDSVLHGRSGLLVRPGDSRAFADSIALLLDDPDRRKALGQCGRAHVSRLFDIETTVSVVEDVYRRYSSAGSFG